MIYFPCSAFHFLKISSALARVSSFYNDKNIYFNLKLTFIRNKIRQLHCNFRNYYMHLLLLFFWHGQNACKIHYFGFRKVCKQIYVSDVLTRFSLNCPFPPPTTRLNVRIIEHAIRTHICPFEFKKIQQFAFASFCISLALIQSFICTDCVQVN